MKIKSISDVITNSSTEVFVLRDPRKSSEEVNNYLRDIGFPYRVSLFTKDTSDSDICTEINDIFCNRETKNHSWYYLYLNFLNFPKSITPLERKLNSGEILRVYPNEEGEELNDLQKKFVEDFDLIEKVKSDNPTFYAKQEFIKHPTKHNFSCINLHGYLSKDEIMSWIVKNEDLFPEYNLLLEMSDKHDITSVYNTWVAIIPDDYGEIYETTKVFKNLDINYDIYSAY